MVLSRWGKKSIVRFSSNNYIMFTCKQISKKYIKGKNTYSFFVLLQYKSTIL